ARTPTPPVAPPGMKIDVHFTPLGLVAGDLAGRCVVVVDALRATTTIVTALANGAKAVIPAATSEEAVRLASNLEKDGVVLAGERRSVKIEGFALGNSPREMTAAAVAGKTIVLATSNGTPALVATQGGDPVLVGAPANFKALAERARALLAQRGDLVIVCGGRCTRTAASHEPQGAPGADRHRRPRGRAVPRTHPAAAAHHRQLGRPDRLPLVARARGGLGAPAGPRHRLGAGRVRAAREPVGRPRG